MRPLEQVSNLINCLSNDEDVRQDLWVCYLSGEPTESLENRLQRIQQEYAADVAFQESIWQLIKNPPSEELATLIVNNFTEYERSIICCLMLGLNTGQISDIKGISQVRIKQSIATIRYNSVWEKHYGTKEKSNRRRKTRAE